MTLTEFLTARLDEDEATAQDERVEDIPGDCWGPKRVLREIEAKRAILALHRQDQDDEPDEPAWCVWDGFTWPCETLRPLAAVYSDHPDYDEAWRP